MPDDTRISKRLSLWLRHKPGAAGLTLDEQGWTKVEPLLAALQRQKLDCDWECLLRVVRNSDKQRFELSPDATKIRARQGHSVKVTLDWPSVQPPELLYHGTVERFLDAIMTQGLRPMNRHHVHLSPDRETACKVGMRRGPPVILKVRARDLHQNGQEFLLTSNMVWLTEAVPPQYLSLA